MIGPINTLYRNKKTNFSKLVNGLTSTKGAMSVSTFRSFTSSRLLNSKGFSLLLKLLALMIFIILLITSMYFISVFILPFYSLHVKPVMDPYLQYIRYAGIIITTISLYKLIANLNTTKVTNPYISSTKSNTHLPLNELGMVEDTKYRWWVNPLRIGIALSLVLFGLVYPCKVEFLF